MGGFGSTRWGCHQKKAQAESSRRLYAKMYRSDCLRIAAGHSQNMAFNPSWTQGGRPSGNVTLYLSGDNGDVKAVIVYTVTNSQGKKDYRYQIGFETVKTPWGAVRYYWTCPDCHHRAGCLYLPPGASLFRCRRCADVSYIAAQETRSSPLDAMFLAKCGMSLTEWKAVTDWQASPGKPPPVKVRRVLSRIMEDYSPPAPPPDRYADYLDAETIRDRSGLSIAQLDELREVRLLVPDHGDRYRPKLTGWAGKLAALLRDGWTIAEVKRWATGRYSSANPRQFPPDRRDWQG